MLEIFYARENIDKEKFIYDNTEGETLVIVPNQYTLIAEKQALKYLKKACLFNVEIMSMNRLGLRILEKQGIENHEMLDKYGRYMLLSKIITDKRESLKIFRGLEKKKAFIEMVNDFISDFKQQNCTMAEFSEIAGEESADPILMKKIADISLVIEEYNKAIEGRYTDSEDYIEMYNAAIKDSAEIPQKDIWVYGFDSLTPKFMNTLLELAQYSRCTRLVLNDNNFGLKDILIKKLTEMAEENEIEVKLTQINTSYEIKKSETITRIESDLYSEDEAAALERNKDFMPADLTVVEAANPYYEAESAAAYILKLLRDKNYKMSDIALICNDEKIRSSIIKRTFSEYELPVFIDRSRNISSSQIAVFIVNQLEFISNRYRTSNLISMLKSGLTDLSRNEIENLENYASGYSIKGTMWTKPFKYGDFEYEEDEFRNLEESRIKIMSAISGLESIIGEAQTIKAFADKYYTYLEDEWNIKWKIQMISMKQKEKGLIEESLQTDQTFNAAGRILSQVVEVLGDQPMDLKQFLVLYTEGMENLEIGAIPPTVDGLLMGTMQRTRLGPVKAVIMLGVNEGILPMEPSTEGLFSLDEKGYFNSKGFAFGGIDSIKALEEKAAMYRIISKSSEKLFIGYSLANEGGSDVKASSLVEDIKTVFPKTKIYKDIVSEGLEISLVNNAQETLMHTVNYLKKSDGNEERLTLCHTILKWYEKNKSDMLDAMLDECLDENRQEAITKEMARELFTGKDNTYSFSPSRLEKYFRCSFQHFISYGLKPDEPRIFETSGREQGDIYHECIMRVSRDIKEHGARWSDYTKEEIEEKVHEKLDLISKEYRGGLLLSNGREGYRRTRIEKTCKEAVWAVLEQMKNGSVKEAYFEDSFKRGYNFPPIQMDIDGEVVYIEGKIDRVDLLEDDTIRIVDYKTGPEKLDLAEVYKGYKLQLMIYMKGAAGDKYKPAGIFYFNIKEDIMPVNKLNSKKMEIKLEEEGKDQFKLNGAYIDGTADDAAAKEIISKSAKSMDREYYEELKKHVEDAVRKISEGIINGDISLEPTRLSGSKHETPCDYCSYKAICKFDIAYRDNNYKMI